MTAIRYAQEGDLLDIVDMGRDFFDHSGFASITKWDPESFSRTVIALINAGNGGTLLVIDENGLLVGMAGSVTFPFFFNTSMRLSQELFWWVDPEHRDGVGVALLDELEADARRKGADVFITAHIAGQRDEAFARAYRRRGYQPSENMFIRKLSS